MTTGHYALDAALSVVVLAAAGWVVGCVVQLLARPRRKP